MGLYASGTFQSLDALEANPCSHGSVSRLVVWRAIPHAPFVNNKRRAGDCPPTKLDRPQAGGYRFVAAAESCSSASSTSVLWKTI